MKRQFFLGVLAVSLANTASAAFIVGNTYYDSGSVAWQYIGQFGVANGPAWFDGGPTYNGLEAAALLFGPLGPNQEYALSTDDAGLTVDHLAWYDGYGQTQHLNYGTNVGLAEDINEDPGNDGYNYEFTGGGDWSAYIRDHESPGGPSVNFVFQRTVSTPEPVSMALLGLTSLAGLGLRLRRNRKTQDAQAAA